MSKYLATLSFLGLTLTSHNSTSILKSLFLASFTWFFLHFESWSLLFLVHSLDKSYFVLLAPTHQCWLLKLTQVQNRSGCCLLCLPVLIKYKPEKIFDYFSCFFSYLGSECQSVSVWRVSEISVGLCLAVVGLCLGLEDNTPNPV